MLEKKSTLTDSEILTEDEIKHFVENVVNNFFDFTNCRINWKKWEWCNDFCWRWKNSIKICEAKCRNLRKYDTSLKYDIIYKFTEKLIEEKNNWNFNKESIKNYILTNYINIKIKSILNNEKRTRN